MRSNFKVSTSNAIQANATTSAHIHAAKGINPRYWTSGYAGSGAAAMQYKGLLSPVLRQAKALIFFILLASVTAAAQSNKLTVSAVGNFNPVTWIYINQAIPAMGSSQKSSAGGSVEYDHWITPYQAFGVIYEQNPSDGKLHGAANAQWYIWPQMRYELLGVFTTEVNIKRLISLGQQEAEKTSRLTPFVQEGAGAVVTHENDKSDNAGAGWSHSIAIAVGFGSDYRVNNRLSLRLGTLIIADQNSRSDWML